MLKVLRKYNKMILVVGGTLLLISFLIPQAIQQLGRARMGRAVGTMDGRKVSLASFDEAQRQYVALKEFYGHIDAPFPIALEDGHEIEHWLLLTTEARMAGLVGGANEGASLLPIYADMLVESAYTRQYQQFGLPFAEARWYAAQQIQANTDEVQQIKAAAMARLAEARARAAGAARMSYEQFDEALAAFRGLVRLLDSYTQAERISDRQAVAIARGLAESVLIDSAFLSARRLADKALEPTPEELKAHFDRFRAVKPGQGEYGIGYFLPARVRLEWIELSRPAIEGAIKISLPDATKHYHQNRDRYPAPFAEERSKVDAELRRARAQDVMRAADEFVRAEISRAIRPLEKEGDYRILPAGWESQRPDFVKIADRLVASLSETEGVTIPTPAVRIQDKTWLDGAKLAAQPGIGSATVQFGQQSYTFPQVAFSVRELAGESMLALQVGIPASDLAAVGRDGSRYFFNILSTAPEEVPGSIDEALDPEAVVQDWRALRQYEVLAASAAEFEGRAAKEGLEAFAQSFGVIEREEPKVEPTEAPAGADDAPAASEGAESEDQSGQTGGAEAQPASQDAPEDQAPKNAADDASADEAPEAQPGADSPEKPAEPPADPKVAVLKNAGVYESHTTGLLVAQNSPEVIAAVRERAASIDPKTPIETVPLEQRVIAVPVPNRLGVLVAQINGVQPLTWETLPRFADEAAGARWRETFQGVGVPVPFRFEPLKARHAFSMRREEGDEPATDAPAGADARPADAQS